MTILLLAALALAPAAAASRKDDGLVRAINRVRASHHLRPLRVSEALNRWAQRHSDSMARTHVLAHALPLRFPVRSRALGEDLAWVPSDRPSSVVAAWLASPVHRTNLLSPRFHRVGVGDVDGLVTADFAG